MEDQELNSEEQEIATPETETNELQHDAEETQAQDVEKADEQERNWRAMRQRQKEMEWELKQRDEMLDFYKKNQVQPQASVEQEEPEIADDEYTNAGNVKGIARKTVQPLEKKVQELEQKLAQQEQGRLLNSLRSQFPDFDDVVNVETLEILEKSEPELASTIAEFKDPYKMGIHSYKYIKALNLIDKLPKSRRSKEVQKKIEKNEKTVQSPMAYDKRPMAQAFKSTAADKKRLYEEMMGYAGQASGL